MQTTKNNIVYVLCVITLLSLTSCKLKSAKVAYETEVASNDIIDSVNYSWKGELGEEIEIKLEFFAIPCITPCPCPQWVPQELMERIWNLESDTIPVEVPEYLSKELVEEYTWIEPENDFVKTPFDLLASNNDVSYLDSSGRLICRFRGRYFLERQELIICFDTFNSKVFRYSNVELSK